MSESRMIHRTRILAITGFSGLAIIAMALCGCHRINPCPPIYPVKPGSGGNNPPVVVTGGSLYGQSLEGWSAASSCNPNAHDPLEFCATLPNGDSNVLSFTRYIHAANQTIPPNQSWTIVVTDGHPDDTENPGQGIQLCDNAACDPTVKVPDLNHVYIRPYNESDSGWDSASTNGEKYFHDKSDNCDAGDTAHKGGPCDYPHTAVLAVGNPSNQQKYKCSEKHTCQIGVGNE
jgi:hypothetical protein